MSCLLLGLLAGCGQAAEAPSAGGLTGLYESGGGPRRNQLCMAEREGRPPSFGLIVWGDGNRSCGATGLLRLEGDRLTLLPDGDESCAMEARLEGDRVTLPDSISGECARFYCGAGVRMEGAVFERAGSSAADAGRAFDIAGDRLCAE